MQFNNPESNNIDLESGEMLSDWQLFVKQMTDIMDKTIPEMSSEEIADEIQKEGLEENIPYYAAMIEGYADSIAEARAQQLLSDLEIFRKLNEDDFDRGKGKYLLKRFIENNN